MNLKDFSPLVFLTSLGAGGIAVMPFVLMQYTIEHGKGLVTSSQIGLQKVSLISSIYFSSLEAVMIIFTLLHFVLSIWFTIKLVKWMKTDKFSKLINNPLKNTAVLAPLISLLMTMNMFIGPIRYFIPVLADNFQNLILPSMIFWTLVFVFVLFTEIKLLVISFKKGFDIYQNKFWLVIAPVLIRHAHGCRNRHCSNVK